MIDGVLVVNHCAYCEQWLTACLLWIKVHTVCNDWWCACSESLCIQWTVIDGGVYQHGHKFQQKRSSSEQAKRIEASEGFCIREPLARAPFDLKGLVLNQPTPCSRTLIFNFIKFPTVFHLQKYIDTCRWPTVGICHLFQVNCTLPLNARTDVDAPLKMGTVTQKQSGTYLTRSELMIAAVHNNLRFQSSNFGLREVHTTEHAGSMSARPNHRLITSLVMQPVKTLNQNIYHLDGKADRKDSQPTSLRRYKQGS